jgi:hypothetical protein
MLVCKTVKILHLTTAETDLPGIVGHSMKITELNKLYGLCVHPNTGKLCKCISLDFICLQLQQTPYYHNDPDFISCYSTF